MGTKGRDLVLWLLVLLVPAAAVASLLGADYGAKAFWLALGCTAGLGVFERVTIPRARRRSQAWGLKHVVLLPINRWWAALLLAAAGRRMPWCERAYEIHIPNSPSNLHDYLVEVEADLLRAKDILPGCLFLWETSAPVPSRIRRLIRDLKKDGLAFWEPGMWPVPRFPLIPSQIDKRHVRRGALALPGGKGGA